jgi:hypothetical protein
MSKQKRLKTFSQLFMSQFNASAIILHSMPFSSLAVIEIKLRPGICVTYEERVLDLAVDLFYTKTN